MEFLAYILGLKVGLSVQAILLYSSAHSDTDNWEINPGSFIWTGNDYGIGKGKKKLGIVSYVERKKKKSV